MIIDNNGAQRHTMTLNQLAYLTRQINDFLADCTTEEADNNKDAFIAIKTLIHQHEQEYINQAIRK